MLYPFTTAALAILMPFAVFSQSAPPPRAFEAASVRPHDGPTPRMGISTAGSRLTGEAENLRSLIMYAYNLKNYQVAGAMSDIFYDIVAKAEGNGAPTPDEFRQMVQSLLADRFKLQVHREMREMPVYALLPGKNPLKLKESAPDAKPMQRLGVDGRNYVVTNARATMDDLVGAIANAFPGRPVVDKTGLSGTYDLKLTYTPDVRSNRESEPGPSDISVFTAVRDQLGLRLEPQKAMVEVLVIDRLEKPSEN